MMKLLSGCLDIDITSYCLYWKWMTSNLIPTKWMNFPWHRIVALLQKEKSDLKSSYWELNFLSNDLGRENKRCSCVRRDEFCNVIKQWIWRNLPKEIISFCNMPLLLSLPPFMVVSLSVCFWSSAVHWCLDQKHMLSTMLPFRPSKQWGSFCSWGFNVSRNTSSPGQSNTVFSDNANGHRTNT